MVKIDKTDIENIQLISKETKLHNITSVRIKKGNYEIEISSQSNLTKPELMQLQENKTTKQKLKNNNNEIRKILFFICFLK